MAKQALRTTLLQIPLVWENAAANRRAISEKTAGLEGKTDLLVLPEMYTTGFTMKPQGLSESMDGLSLSWMEDLASRLDAVVMGSLIIEVDGQFFNRLLAVGPEGLLLHYDKRHLFRMAGEDESYQAGQELPILNWRGWKICPQVCYDLRFPAWSRNQFDASGHASYDVLVYVANWPAVRVSHWKALLLARAIENQAFVLGVNRVGEDGNGIAYSGDSAIVDFLGNIQETLVGKAGLLQQELDGEGLMRYRDKFPAWRDADSFTIQ